MTIGLSSSGYSSECMQEVERKEEDMEGQVEVEEERRLKEVRSWMTMEMFMTRLRS